MLYSALAGLICTVYNLKRSLNPDNSRYFCSKCFKDSLYIYFINYYKLVN